MRPRNAFRPDERLVVEELLERAGFGSSQPWVGRVAGGGRYSVKFRGAGPGPRALVAEFVVHALAARWDWPLPRARAVWIEASLARVGTDEFWDVLDRSVGWNLGIEWIDGACDVDLATADLPVETVDAIVLVDSLFANYDRTTLSSNLVVGRDGRFWLIDHGSCLFLDELDDDAPSFGLAPNHFSRRVVPRGPAPAALAEGEIAWLLRDLPREWLEAVALPRDRLVGGLCRRLEAFRAFLAR